MELQLPPVSASAPKESGGEFNVISTTRSFTLSTSSTAMRDEWMAAIQSAISQLQSRQSTFPTNSAAVESVAVVPRLGQKVSCSFKISFKCILFDRILICRLQFGHRINELLCVNFAQLLSA